MIDEQQDAECCNDVIQVIAAVKVPEHEELERQAEGERGRERKREGCKKTAGERKEGDCEICAQHVLGAVRKIYEIHHPEDQRETRCDQEQQHAELQPIEDLNDDKAGGHGTG